MVQARPGAQPTLLPGPCAAWISGFSGEGSDLTGAREAQERSRWSPTESPSASVSPVAKVSKFTLSSELEEERTGRGPGRPPDWESHSSEAPAEPMGTHRPCSSQHIKSKTESEAAESLGLCQVQHSSCGFLLSVTLTTFDVAYAHEQSLTEDPMHHR